ncbi:MAPEG family protein [Kordiimonas pumila]|uniref:MAPEG family protein n=1 Tax=Kordiimonas pumila TaxID=2161677 RepID=A0ABV7D2J6_9PROT|nr:MAPEG family protein [Kordiimonas pumila]
MLDTILYPLATQVLLTFIILFILAYRRLSAYAAGKTNGAYFKVFSGAVGSEPEDVQVAQRSFLNQFEMPVLFIAACIAAQVFGKADSIVVIMAWCYAALRIVHALVHLIGNNVLHRFRVFILSNIVLLVMWVLIVLP